MYGHGCSRATKDPILPCRYRYQIAEALQMATREPCEKPYKKRYWYPRGSGTGIFLIAESLPHGFDQQLS